MRVLMILVALSEIQASAAIVDRRRLGQVEAVPRGLRRLVPKEDRALYVYVSHVVQQCFRMYTSLPMMKILYTLPSLKVY